MVDMALIGGAANSLNVALNIAKAMLGIRDQALITEKALELGREIMTAQQSVMEAQAAQFALIERVRDLEKKLMEAETWKDEKGRYELKAVSAGGFAYVVKATDAGSEPPHWICATCYQAGRKSILQVRPIQPLLRHNRVWACASCTTTFETSENQGPERANG